MKEYDNSFYEIQKAFLENEIAEYVFVLCFVWMF